MDVAACSAALECTWQISPTLAARIAAVMVQWHASTGGTISVFSGYRTEQEQDALRARGRPTAARGVSTHTLLPASGADLRFSGFVDTEKIALFGQIVSLNGLRWGGGSSLDPATGNPSDWQHVDLGPRIS